MIKRNRFRIIACLTLTVALSCGTKQDQGDGEEDLKPVYGGTFVYGKNGPPLTLDAAKTRETESSIIVGNVFDGLVQQRAGRIAIDPALATRWDISDDGKTYTFHLRQGVQFHDGTPFNADAVVFTFERQKDAKGDFEYWHNLNMEELVKEIKSVNDSTVRIQLTQADATFLNVLSLNFLFIVSPDAVKKYGEDFSRHPVGTGPFRFVSWNEDGTVITVANEHFWHGRPYLDTLIFKPVRNAMDRWNQLKNNEITMIGAPDKSFVDDIMREAGITTMKQHGVNVAYMSMNMRKKPFDNLKVRQAVVYAINREDLVRRVYGQFGRPAKNPIPPVLLGYNEEIRYSPYDPEKSKQLLAEAGYANGFKCNLYTMTIFRDYMPDGVLAGTIVQEYLKAVGIQADTVLRDWQTFLSERGNGKHDLAIGGWIGDAPDPHFFFHFLLDKTALQSLPTNNNAFYASDVMHDLIEKAKITVDPVERSNLYKQACVVFNEDLPWFTIAHALNMVVMRKSVTNFQMHASSTRRFDKVWLQP